MKLFISEVFSFKCSVLFQQIIACQWDLMWSIQPAENAALLTFGCCQPINEGGFAHHRC